VVSADRNKSSITQRAVAVAKKKNLKDKPMKDRRKDEIFERSAMPGD